MVVVARVVVVLVVVVGVVIVVPMVIINLPGTLSVKHWHSTDQQNIPS